VSLSSDEKCALTKAWVSAIEAPKVDMLCIINVSATSIKRIREHFELCSTLAVDAIAVLPPFYYRSNSADKTCRLLEASVVLRTNTAAHLLSLSRAYQRLP